MILMIIFFFGLNVDSYRGKNLQNSTSFQKHYINQTSCMWHKYRKYTIWEIWRTYFSTSMMMKQCQPTAVEEEEGGAVTEGAFKTRRCSAAVSISCDISVCSANSFEECCRLLLSPRTAVGCWRPLLPPHIDCFCAEEWEEEVVAHVDVMQLLFLYPLSSDLIYPVDPFDSLQSLGF